MQISSEISGWVRINDHLINKEGELLNANGVSMRINSIDKKPMAKIDGKFHFIDVLVDLAFNGISTRIIPDIDVEQIKSYIADGHSDIDIAAYYGVSSQYIWLIKKGQRKNKTTENK